MAARKRRGREDGAPPITRSGSGGVSSRPRVFVILPEVAPSRGATASITPRRSAEPTMPAGTRPAIRWPPSFSLLSGALSRGAMARTTPKGSVDGIGGAGGSMATRRPRHGVTAVKDARWTAARGGMRRAVSVVGTTRLSCAGSPNSPRCAQRRPEYRIHRIARRVPASPLRRHQRFARLRRGGRVRGQRIRRNPVVDERSQRPSDDDEG